MVNSQLLRQIKIRKVASKLSYRRRDIEALSSNEQVVLKGYKRKLMYCMLKARMEGGNSKVWDDLGKDVMVEYMKIVMDMNPPLPAVPNRERTIDSFPADVCGPFFRFRTDELHRIKDLLNFPAIMKFPNRSTLSGEEVMLRGLYELATGENQFRIAMNVFGGGQPLQSFAFTAFISHVYDNFEHLVHDSMIMEFCKSLLTLLPIE